MAWLGSWDRGRTAPVAALTAQAVIAVAMVFSVGTAAGRTAVDTTLAVFGIPEIPWEEYFGGFETLVTAAAPVFWAFFLSTGIAVFVLRWKDGQRERPFKIPFFEAPALIFCCMCAYMLYSSLVYARALTLLGFAPIALGAIFYTAVARRDEARSVSPSDEKSDR